MQRNMSVVVLVLFSAFAAFGAARNPSTAQPSQGDGGVSPFYTWGKKVPRKPGKLLRQEPLASNLMLSNASQGARILYSSTDGIDGKTPVAVSGAIYLPKGQAPAGGWPLVAWAHGTTGIADVCAPSWIPRSARDTDYLNAWLGQGFAIVATDYEGLGTPGMHPRRVSKSEGWSVLDSIRAALGTFPVVNRVVIIGQSQGGGASVSASLLAPRYAPEINLLGTVATGIPWYAPFSPAPKGEQIPVPERMGGGLNAASAIVHLHILTLLDPKFQPSDYLTADAMVVFEKAKSACQTELNQAADERHLTTTNIYKKNPLEANDRWMVVERYPTPHFDHPIFIGTGLADVTALPEGQYNVAQAGCSEGSTVEHHYYPGLDHGGAVNGSLKDSIPFVKKLLGGEKIEGNCSSLKPPSALR